MPGLTVNIVTYRLPGPLLEKALKSLVTTAPSQVAVNLINNGPALENPPAAVRVIENGPDNRHLSATWNMAMGLSKTPWAMIANDDIVFRPGWFEAWREAAGHGYGLVGSGFSCFSLSQEAFELVGGFDEGFRYGYAEDTDFICRALLKGLRMSQEFSGVDFEHRLKGYLHHLHRDDPEAYALKVQPRTWPAHMREYNLEYFRQKWGDRPVPTFYRLLPRYPHAYRYETVRSRWRAFRFRCLPRPWLNLPV